MSLITQRVDNLLGGVSQHPEHLRAPSQATEQINCISSPAVGLAKRPPTEHVAVLATNPAGYDGAFIHDIQRDDDTRYRVVLTEGRVQVFDSTTGAEMPVTMVGDAAGYLTSDGEYRAVTIRDTTVITNRAKTVTHRRDKRTPKRRPEALVYVRQADFSTVYNVTIDGVTFRHTTVDGSRPEARQQIRTDYIAERLHKDMVELGDPKFSYVRAGSVIHVSRWDGADFTLTTTDGLGDSGLRVIKGSVQTVDELPLKARDGFTVEVVGDPSTPRDNYYLTYDSQGTAGDAGVWRETARPDSLTDLTDTSLPHLLVNGGEYMAAASCAPLPPIPEVSEGAVETTFAGWDTTEAGAPVLETVDDQITEHQAGRSRLVANVGVSVNRTARANFALDTSTMEPGAQVDVRLEKVNLAGGTALLATKTFPAGQTFDAEYLEGSTVLSNGERLKTTLSYSAGETPNASRRALLTAPRMEGGAGFTSATSFSKVDNGFDDGFGGGGNSGGVGRIVPGPEYFDPDTTIPGANPFAHIRFSFHASGLVKFDGTGSYGVAGAEIVKYEWHFEDSGAVNAVGPLVEGTFNLGLHVVRLVVTDDAGGIGEQRQIFEFPAEGGGGGNSPGPDNPEIIDPNGNYIYNPIFTFHRLPAAMTYRFDGSASHTTAQTPITYAWDFADGTTAVGPIADHTFAQDGFYNVRLTISDDLGSATAVATVNVYRQTTDPPVRPPGVEVRKVLSRYITFGAAQMYPAGYKVVVDVGGTPFTYTAPNKDVPGTEVSDTLMEAIHAYTGFAANLVAPGVVEVLSEVTTDEAPAVKVRPESRPDNTAWFPLATLEEDSLVGKVALNVTDGSEGTVTRNTSTTVVVSKLRGGGFNLFQADDKVRVKGPEGTFTFGPATWAPRVVGDPESNPWPGVVGKRVVDVFYHKSRLGLLTGDGFVLSELGEMFRLFRSTVTDLLPTAPIDLDTALPDAAKFHAAAQWNGGVYLFTGNHEYQITGEPLAPTTAGLLLSSSFGSSPNLRPLPAGGRLFLGKARTGVTQVLEYVHRKDYPASADDVTAHVPSYLKGSPVALAVDGSLGFLTVLSADKRDSLYVYFYSHREDGVRQQAAWSRWDFAPGTTILHTSMLDGKLALIVKRRDGVYYETLDLADALNWDG